MTQREIDLLDMEPIDYNRKYYLQTVGRIERLRDVFTIDRYATWDLPTPIDDTEWRRDQPGPRTVNRAAVERNRARNKAARKARRTDR